MAMIGIVALLAAVVTTTFGSGESKDQELRNPQVLRTFPADGQVLSPGPFTLTISYDTPMLQDSYSYVQSDKGAFPMCGGKPRLLQDGKTFEYDCMAEAGKNYHVRFNHGRFMNFKSAANQVPAMSYAVSFSAR